MIGHLAKRYTTNGTGLQDAGVRVVADEASSYEADAMLLVERNGVKRTIRPIIKPPRPPYLLLNQEYAAVLATLFPDQALDLSLLVEQLGQERESVRKLRGDVPPLTTGQVRAMSQTELEEALTELRAQATALEKERAALPLRRAGGS